MRVLLLFLCVGCTKVLPPVAQPEQVQPQVEANMPAPPQGFGRVVFDVTDGPTEVYAVSSELVRRFTLQHGMRTVSRTRTDVICMTPCATDLPYGQHLIGFPMLGDGGFERASITVGDQPLVMRRTLGSRRDAGGGLVLGILGTTFGAMATIVGAVLLPVGLSTDGDGLTLGGAVTLGIGGALMIGGILGIALNPSIREPGASIIFPLQ